MPEPSGTRVANSATSTVGAAAVNETPSVAKCGTVSGRESSSAYPVRCEPYGNIDVAVAANLIDVRTAPVGTLKPNESKSTTPCVVSVAKM
jgi:hypothetical protein